MNDNPFRIGSRPAGFRIFESDIMIGIFVLFMTVLGMIWMRSHEGYQLIVLLPIVVLAHFFLFCNVFRVARIWEILWGLIFMITFAGCFIWHSDLEEPVKWTVFLYWRRSLLLQLPFTLAVILITIFSKDYHGIGYKHLPWGRKVKSIPNESVRSHGIESRPCDVGCSTKMAKLHDNEKPTQWVVQHGDILDVASDVLICSANPQLNMSGGVGGAILVRYGNLMQEELRKYLLDRKISFVAPGTIVQTASCGTSFRFVLHAVAVDVFYNTSHELLVKTLRHTLNICRENRVETVSLTALATGYGRYPIANFARAVSEIDGDDFYPVKEIKIVIQNQFAAEELYRSRYGGDLPSE